MKLLVDMNLSPEWVTFLTAQGFEAQHWSAVGAPHADDREIMEFARLRGFIVFTHDLDFGNILAVTNARGPSVVQVRTQNPTVQASGELVVSVLHQQKSQLERGVLITVEPDRMRLRVLPLWQGAG